MSNRRVGVGAEIDAAMKAAEPKANDHVMLDLLKRDKKYNGCVIVVHRRQNDKVVASFRDENQGFPGRFKVPVKCCVVGERGPPMTAVECNALEDLIEHGVATPDGTGGLNITMGAGAGAGVSTMRETSAAAKGLLAAFSKMPDGKPPPAV